MPHHPQFETALDALDRGDLSGLQSLLTDHPELARAGVESDQAPYDGYFWRATLLHHVAGNPIRGTLPDNIVDIATALLDAGAEVDATCGGGPSQPESAGGTTLGLVVSGMQAHIQGHTEGLIDLLVQRGASIDPVGNGGLLWIATYHVVEHRGQREVAEMLVQRGHPTDFCFAAALGRLDLMQTWSSADGTLRPGADHLFRHHRGSKDEATQEQILTDALIAASASGREQTVSWLLDRGAPIDAWRRWGPWRVTPLHAAAWAGWPGVLQLLLARGADPHLRDPAHHSTPLGWAIHCGRDGARDLLLQDDDHLDLGDAVEVDRPQRVAQLLGDSDPDQPFGPAPRGALLRTATYYGALGVVELLLSRGADASLPGADGKSALDWAEERGHQCIAQLLKG